ncbi:MAG: hypothetical protein ACOVOV_06645 [Dolichospermum sp.]
MKLPPPLQNQGLEANQPTNKVEQKMYDLPTEQTTALIKTFKKQFSNAINLRSAQTSLALDSSVWLLEAALNYDFDSPKTTEIGYTDSLKFTTPITNNTLNGSDFGTAYSALANLLSQKINATTKIQVIDVTATIEEDAIVYACNVTLFHTTNGQRIATPCDPFTTETASPSKFATTLPSYANPFLSCTLNPTLDGPTQVEIKLNSCSFPSCSNGYYYTNVTSRTIDPLSYSQYQSSLYYRVIASAGDYCLNANKIITAAQLNTYKSTCNSIATAFRPTTPAGLQILNNYDLSLMVTSQPCCSFPRYAYWKLTVKYGTVNCNSGGGGGS